MARAVRLSTNVTHTWSTENGARANFAALIDALKSHAVNQNVDDILWNTLELSSSVFEVETGSIVESQTDAYVVWSAIVMGVTRDD